MCYLRWQTRPSSHLVSYALCACQYPHEYVKSSSPPCYPKGTDRTRLLPSNAPSPSTSNRSLPRRFHLGPLLTTSSRSPHSLKSPSAPNQHQPIAFGPALCCAVLCSAVQDNSSLSLHPSSRQSIHPPRPTTDGSMTVSAYPFLRASSHRQRQNDFKGRTVTPRALSIGVSSGFVRHLRPASSFFSDLA